MMAPPDNKIILATIVSDILAFAWIVALAAFVVWAAWGGLMEWVGVSFY